MKQGKAHIYSFEVLTNKLVARDTFYARLLCPDAAAVLKAGQFVSISVSGDPSHMLRIPLSYAYADSQSGVVDIAYARVGEGTSRLASMQVGEESTLLAPLGNGWPIINSYRRVLLVAGGIGLPPVVSAAHELASHDIGFDAVYGVQSQDLLWGEGIDVLRSLTPHSLCDCERRVSICTDDGTLGVHGFVTGPMQELISKRDYDAVMACGPSQMLKAVAAIAKDAKLTCYISLERMMGCGFGACTCCNVELTDGKQALCCIDGPVFDANEVVL